MNYKNIDKQYLNALDNLSKTLDYLCSSDIEDNDTNNVEPSITKAISSVEFLAIHAHETQSNVDFLLPFKEKLQEAHHYNNKKGFSKTAQWIDFIEFVTMINAILKDILKKHKEISD